MYYEYFQLKEHPFRLTCAPKYFYLSPEHAHAQSMMEYALVKRQGLTVLTGEVGSGKTMLAQHFLSRIDDSYFVVQIQQTQLSEVEFIQLLLLSFDLAVEGTQTKQALLRQLDECITQRHNEGQHTLFIIDEAQNLDVGVIAHLYQMSRMKDENGSFCSVYLIGQNALRETLDDSSVKELISNVNSKYHLNALSLKEIKNYICYRLAVAGGHKSIKMADDIFPIIEAYTGGRPRLINVLTDHILTYTYLEGLKEITAKVVDAAISDLQWLPFGLDAEEDTPKEDSPFEAERRLSYKLVIQSENNVRSEYFIRNKRISIGRHSKSDLRVDDQLMSRNHAQIIQQGRTIYLRDLNSTNGTYLDSKRVDIAALEEGMTIRVGRCHLTFMRDQSEQLSDAQPSVDDRVIEFAAT